ncbi:MAG: glycosyltransferase family 2 protein [Flavobacterium sp.]
MNKSINSKPVLSFCISTYNRADKIFKLINDILKYKGDNIEVIVSDNSSTDDTILELSKIQDDRFRFFVNSPNIGAIPNYMKAISEGTGEYVFFSTDKDSINASGIYELINFFSNHTYIVAGYSKLDVCQKAKETIFNQGIDSLSNLAYLSYHPTGYFFKNERLKKLDVLKNYTDFERVGVFPFEFIIAELSMQGKTAIIELPLFYMETMEEVENVKSFSYSGAKNNLYFSPHQRFVMSKKYIKHLLSLKLSKIEKRLIIKKIFKYSLSSATLGYKLMLENKFVCDHYGIKTEKIGLLKILLNDLSFSRKFIFNSEGISLFLCIIICLEVHFEYIFKIN